MSSSQETSQNSFNEFENSIFINLGVFSVLLIAFEINRHFKLIYFNRVKDKTVKEGRVPPVPPKVPLGWLSQIAKVPEEEILRMLGLDAYMYLRFIKICMRVSGMGAVLGICILLPAYSSCGGGQTDWNRFTLANIPTDTVDNSEKLWIPVIFSYLFTIYFMYLTQEEYKAFVEKRQDYLLKGDHSTHPQTYYTCMIERVPSDIRTVQKLKEYFESFFPNQVYSVEICLEVHELEALAAARHDVRNFLEKAVAIWKATDQRQTIWVKKDCYDEFEDPPQPVEQSYLATCFGYVIYDAIEHWSKQLVIMNNRVKELQIANLEFANHVSSKNLDTSRLSFFTNKIVDVTHQVATTLIQTHGSENKLCDSLIQNETLGGSDGPARPRNDSDALKFTPTNSNLNGAALELRDTDSVNGDIVKDKDSKDKDKDEQSVVSSVVEGGKTIVNTGIGVFSAFGKEGIKTVKLATRGVVRGLHKATRTLELLTIGADFKVSNTAFVTFTNRQAQASTHQCLLSHRYDYYKMGITNAPSPSDIIWENIAVPIQQNKLRKNVIDIGLYIGLLFWTSVVLFITSLGNLDSLSKTRGFHWLGKYTNTTFFQKINSYLAAIVLLVFLNYLPSIFELLSWSYERLKLRSEIQDATFRRYFNYQLAQVFLGVIFGSFIIIINDIKGNDFSSVTTTLGQGVPNLASYFTILVITKTFTALPVEMLRIGPLFQILCVKLFVDKKKCTRRELRTGIFDDPEMEYGCYYPNLMMVLMIMSIYFSISPIIMPFCFLFFGFSYVMYKYQLLYIFVNPYQTGGSLWYAVFPRAMVCLMGGVVVLLCYLLIKGTYSTGPFYGLLPLPLIIWFFWQYCEDRFKVPSLTVSLETAIRIDRTLNGDKDSEDKVYSGFSAIKYRQPSLSEGEVKPEAYRRQRNREDSRHSDYAGDSSSPLFRGRDLVQASNLNNAEQGGSDNRESGYAAQQIEQADEADREVIETEVDGILNNFDETSDVVGRDLERSSNYAKK